MAGIYDIFNHICEQYFSAEGLTRMESRMNELGLVMNLRELGATEEMLEGKFS